VPARNASSSWLHRRAVRQRRSSWANRLSSVTATMLQSYPASRRSAIPSAVLPAWRPHPSMAGMRDDGDTTNSRTDLLDIPGEDVAVVDPASLAERYVALWNEPDPDVRRTIIRGLWAPAGEHVLDPPQELRQPAHALGFEAPTLEVRGYAAIETRAVRAYEEFVAPGQYVFRPRDNAARLYNIVKFNWEMVSTATGEVAGVGLEVLVLDERGRITTDYQFVEG
jgi:hypothetical protein